MTSTRRRPIVGGALLSLFVAGITQPAAAQETPTWDVALATPAAMLTFDMHASVRADSYAAAIAAFGR